MIYILSGNDYKNKKTFLNKLTSDNEIIFLTENNISKEILLNYAQTSNLFGSVEFIVAENVVKNSEVNLLNGDIEKLSISPNVFIFLEDKL